MSKKSSNLSMLLQCAVLSMTIVSVQSQVRLQRGLRNILLGDLSIEMDDIHSLQKDKYIYELDASHFERIIMEMSMSSTSSPPTVDTFPPTAAPSSAPTTMYPTSAPTEQSGTGVPNGTQAPKMMIFQQRNSNNRDSGSVGLFSFEGLHNTPGVASQTTGSGSGGETAQLKKQKKFGTKKGAAKKRLAKKNESKGFKRLAGKRGKGGHE